MGWTLFLDRDGVINKKAPPHHYVTSTNEFELLPGTLDALRTLVRARYDMYIVTQQAGVARGMMTEADVAAVNAHMNKLFTCAGIPEIPVYTCMHGYTGCECRKPKPGLILRASHEHNIDLTRAILVGDTETDITAATAAGIPAIKVSDSEGIAAAVPELLQLPEH